MRISFRFFLLLLVSLLPLSGLQSARDVLVNQPEGIGMINVAFLKSGDLIFRNGRGVVSSWFRRCSLKDPRYSHAGIVLKYKDSVMIAHVSRDFESGLVAESLESFARSGQEMAVYRINVKGRTSEELVRIIGEDLRKGVPFDDQFSLENGSAMYCTEWVNSVFSRAEQKTTSFPLTHAGGFTYFACDNLYLNDRASLITKFESQ